MTDLAARASSSGEFLTLARTHYENFPVGSCLVPRALRRHVHRIYAFARVADDLADERRDPVALAAFRAAFLAHRAGRAHDVPLFADLCTTIRELALPEGLFLDLLDAFEQDLSVNRYADDVALLDYCRKSADPVGRLVLRVFGHDDAALDALSDRICTALQLLNHLQDLGDDLRTRDRIYFPRTDLARFGVREDDLRAPRANDALKALVAHWLDRTATLLRDGWPLTRCVRGRLRWELRAIVGGAAGCVRAIRRADLDVLAHDTKLRGVARVRAVMSALLGSGVPAPLR